MTSIQIDRMTGLVSAAAIKGPCRVATTANIDLNGEQAIDGMDVVSGDRVFVIEQDDARENGIYIASSGEWVRSPDFRNNRDIVKGTMVYVAGGASASGTYVVTSDNPINIGTTEIHFELFSVQVGESPYVYTSRSAAETANVPVAVDNIVILAGHLRLSYVRDPSGTALTTADGATWSPVGDIYPDHFAENVTPGTTDMLAAIHAALALKRVTNFAPAIYAVSGTVKWDNGYKARGAGAHWKRRTGYTPAQGNPTVIRYIGAAGVNSAVVCVSRKPVGQIATSFTPPNGDDLVDYSIYDIHVDANNLADIGWYIYRAGNCKSIDCLTAEKAKERNFLIMGCFAARWGHLGAYESEAHGVEVGRDYFGWNSSEATCYEFNATFHLCNNGTDGTYVKGGVTDLDGSGGIFAVGRGSDISITAESNNGRAAIIIPRAQASSTDGPVTYRLNYLEANGDGVYFRSGPGVRGHQMIAGFIHPGNAVDPVSDRFSGTLKPQDFTIRSYTNAGVETPDEGPTDSTLWPVLSGTIGQIQSTSFGINSNTYKYRIRNCGSTIVYVDKKASPEGVFADGRIVPDSTITTRWLHYCSVSRQSTGIFRVFHNCPHAEYTAAASILSGSSTPTRLALAGNINAGYFDVFVFAVSAGVIGSLADSSLDMEFTVTATR